MNSNHLSPGRFGKSFLFLFTAVLILAHVNAQEKAMVSGRVLAAQKPLSGATITITRLKDSTQLSSVITSADGRFIISGLPMKDSLKMEISFVGFTPFNGLLVLKQKRFAVADISLKPQSAQMDTVIVKAEKLVSVKGDTVEFRASAIKTPPNSIAADLLKRIPGLEIGRDGKLIYNGRPVTKILVDGKPFFGENGSVALFNLPSDMIDRVQIVNDSLQAGNDMANTDLKHVLNLKLKPGKKRFAKTTAAAGTGDRFDGSAFGSMMKDKEKLSLVLGTNNINKAGTNMNNSLQLITNGSGITRTTFGAIDYSNGVSTKPFFNGSYNFNLPHTYKELVKEERQDVLPAATLISNSNQVSRDRSSNHRLDYNYTKAKKSGGLKISGSLTYSAIDNLTTGLASTANGQNNLLNGLQSSYSTKGGNTAAKVSMDGRKYFIRKGKVLEWGSDYNYGNNRTIDHNDALTLFYKNNAIDSQYHFRQEIKNNTVSNAASFHLEYRQPLGTHAAIIFYHAVSSSWGTSDKTTWSLDSLGNKQQMDSGYSNYFKSFILNNESSLSFGYRNNPWIAGAGISLIQNYSNQKDIGQKIKIDQNILNPALRINIGRGSRKNIWQFSSGAMYKLPSMNQLQPVQDLTNPLFILIGNPDLRPEVSYTNIFFFQNKTLQVNGRPLITFNSLHFNYSLVQDKIVASVSYDSLGKQLSTFENVNGTYDLNLQAQLTLQKKWASNFMNIAIKPEVSYLKDRTFINTLLYDNHKLTMQSSLNINYRRNDAVSILINYTPSWNLLRYYQNKSLNQSFTIHKVNTDVDLYLLKKLKLSNSVDYIYNNSLHSNFDRSSLLWNAATSYLCLKNRGEITFSAFDILKQFSNITRTAGGNYIEDTQSNNLQRYFLFGFKYSFGRMDKN